MAKALEEMPTESPSTSQRATPEPNGVVVVAAVADLETATTKKAARDLVLETVTHGVAELGQKCASLGETEAAAAAAAPGIPISFVPALLSTLLTASAESPASRSVAAVVVAALAGVEQALLPAASAGSPDGHKSVAVVGFEALLAQMPSLEATVPKIKSVAANVAAQLVTMDKLTLAQVATPLKGGAHFPLFLLTLQAMVKDPQHKEEAEARTHLKSLVDQSGIKLPEMVPQTSLPNLLSVFSDRGLGFLLPLLRLRVELTKNIKEDPSPKALYAWLQDHVHEDPQLKASADFIHVLTSVLLTYVTEQSTLEAGSEAPVTKEKLEQERLLFAKFSPILKKFVEGDDVDDDGKASRKKNDDDDDNDEGEKRDASKMPAKRRSRRRRRAKVAGK